MKSLIVPCSHLNGTAKNDLLDALHFAAMAVMDAKRALQETCPHGRDYYVYSPDAYSRARAEYEARYQKLDEVYNELGAIFLAITRGERETREQ